MEKLEPSINAKYVLDHVDVSMKLLKTSSLFESVEPIENSNWSVLVTLSKKGVEFYNKAENKAKFEQYFTEYKLPFTQKFNKGDKKEFLGYAIKYCENNDGIILYNAFISNHNQYESHLGSYDSLDSAQSAAILFYMIARPKVFAKILARKILGGAGTGIHLEYLTLINSLQKEGIDIPAEITPIGGSNKLIGYKGQALHYHSVNLHR